jgi:hypothetical protein
MIPPPPFSFGALSPYRRKLVKVDWLATPAVPRADAPPLVPFRLFVSVRTAAIRRKALCSKLCSSRDGKRRSGTGQDGFVITMFSVRNRESGGDS